MSFAQVIAASSSTAGWSTLPTEVKAMVVGKMDLSTALSMMRLGGVEKTVIQEFGKFTIAIGITNQTADTMAVSLGEMNPKKKLETHEVQKWELREVNKGCVVRVVEKSGKIIGQKFHGVPMAKMAFSIVGRVMSNKMFKVMKMELALNNYDGPVDFNLTKPIDVDHVLITRCSPFSAQQIMDNTMIRTDTWFVSFSCRTKLEWAKQKLINIGKEKKWETMVVLRLWAETFLFCPKDTVRTFFKNAQLVTQCGRQL